MPHLTRLPFADSFPTSLRRICSTPWLVGALVFCGLCLAGNPVSAQPTTPSGVGGFQGNKANPASNPASQGTASPNAGAAAASGQGGLVQPLTNNNGGLVTPVPQAGTVPPVQPGTVPQENGAAVQPLVVPQQPVQQPGQQPAAAPAQETAVPQVAETATSKPTLESLQVARDTAVAGLTDEELKKRVGDIYQKSIDNLNLITNLKTREAEYRNALTSVKTRAEDARNRGQLSIPALDLDPATQTLADFQAEATTLEQRVKQLKDEIMDLTSQQSTRMDRRKELQTILSTLPTTLEELRKQLQAPAPDGEAPSVTKARRTELQTQLMFQETRLPVLTLEREWLDAEAANDNLRLELDARRKELAEKEASLAKVNEQLNLKRKEAADKAARAAVAERRTVPAELRPLADENENLAKELVDVTEQLTEAKGLDDEVSKTLEQIQAKYKETQAKVDQVGLTTAIGHLLRKQRVELPSQASLRQYRPQTDEISAAQLTMLQYDDKRSEMVVKRSDQHIFSDEQVAETQQPMDPQLAQQEAELLEKKRELLDQLVLGYDEYFTLLIDLDTNQRNLVKQTSEYRNYIDERVLWIPSGKPIFTQFSVEDSDLWFLAPSVWVKAGWAFANDFRSYSAIWIAAIVVFVGLNYRVIAYRRRIATIGREASSGSAMSFRPTILALLYTIVISLPWPAFLVYLGWRMATQADVVPEEEALHNQLAAIASGLTAVGFALLPLETLRHICRETGLGAAHFGWAGSTLQPINRLIRLLNALGLPLVFATTTLYAVDPTFGNDLVERVCFTLGVVLLTFVIYRLLAPQNGILRNYYASNAGGWLDRLRYVWFAIALFMPILLGILSLIGYYYTACQLSLRLYAMFWLVICLLIGRELIARFILVGRRRSYIEQARLRRAQAAKQASAPEESEVSVAALIGSNKEWSESLSEQTKQSKNLLNSVVIMMAVFGTWLIWADVVPALRVVYKQPLWTTTETVAAPVADGASIEDVTVEERVKNITPTDLLQAMAVLVMTFVVLRNLPGLVDIMILNRLPLDPSTRNAITAICSYLVIVLGVVWAAKLIGVHWTQVQWLVTALTFGLAFGLQEIFANFVAGVIILFERPIRVGDVVTVDEVTGIVTRTRARATTIRNWDLKEFIVPNKEFITGRVLNWTLSDQVTRLVIPVGVAYGSDTNKTSELLLKAAQDHPLVLADPAPLSTFEEFGDSTLNFVLRAYVAKLDDRLKVTSDLHRSIDDLFRQNKIEIAFPQQDLHIRSIPEEWRPVPKNGLASSEEETKTVRESWPSDN